MGENDDAESLADIKMLRESGQQKQSPQWKCRHSGEREHSSCHPVPLVTTLSVSIRCSTSPCTLSTSCYLYLMFEGRNPLTHVHGNVSWPWWISGRWFLWPLFGSNEGPKCGILRRAVGKGQGTEKAPVLPSLLLLLLTRSQWSYCWEIPSSMHERSYSPLNCGRNENRFWCFY